MTDASVQTAAVDVFLALRQPESGHVLFGLRAAHLYAGGMFNLVSGKAEPGENAVSAVLREAREEVGICLAPFDVRPLGAVHTAGSGGKARIGLVFTAEHDPVRHGPVINAEPDKCDDLVWADLGTPPQPLETYNAAALRLLANPGAALIVHGWTATRHRMHLDEPWFDLLARGLKTIELRTADAARAALQPGDEITFINAVDGRERTAEICWLRHYPSFAKALDELPTTAIGGPAATRSRIESALATYYGEARQAAGAVAIGLVRGHAEEVR